MSGPEAAASRELGGLMDDLRSLAAPTDATFNAIGGALGQSLELLERMKSGCEEIVSCLDAAEVSVATSGMHEALRGSAELAASVAGIAALLQDVERDIRLAGPPLQTLQGIVAEIAALATNAKMLVAQIPTDSVDFTVFTVEVGRLRMLADRIVKQASHRLGALLRVLAAARRAGAEVLDDSAEQLADIGRHLEQSLATLAARRIESERSAVRINQLSHGIGQRVSECVGELQVNDMTGQRIEHVWKALEIARQILQSTDGRSGAPAAFGGVPAADLVAAACRLQARQLEHALRDFTVEVEALKVNLRELSDGAMGVMSEAAALVGDGVHGGTFSGELRRRCEAATAFLASYSQAQDQVRRLVAEATGGLRELSTDIAGIQSVDEDLRLMGLNATLKCGRLGVDGRALGVVAQELRLCSRRTEEAARPIAVAIDGTADAAARLAALTEGEQARAAQLSNSLEVSMQGIETLGGVLDHAFQDVTRGGATVSSLLRRASDELLADSRFAGVITRVAERLEAIAEVLSRGGAPPEAVGSELARLFGSQYTMTSERVVHDLFTGGVGTFAGAPAGDAAALDDLFF